MSTAHDVPTGRGPYVRREVCETFRQEQREAHARTWQELRILRRLVILLVVGGQLFTGGLNVAGFGYWLDQHAAHPHASTVQGLATMRAEAREDLKDLRREMHELVVSALSRSRPPRSPDRPNEGEPE